MRQGRLLWAITATSAAACSSAFVPPLGALRRAAPPHLPAHTAGTRVATRQPRPRLRAQGAGLKEAASGAWAQSLLGLWEEVCALSGVDRLVVALERLEELDARLEGAEGDQNPDASAVRSLMQKPEHAAALDTLRERGAKCRELLLTTGHDGAWTLVSERGSTRAYCQPTHDGMTRILLEATSDGLPTEQIALIREADLFRDWLPLCSDSRALKRWGHTQLIFWYKFELLGLACWDLLMQGFGCDCIPESSSILILADSIEHTDLVPPEEIPPHPQGRGSWRIGLRDFRVKWAFPSLRSNAITMTFVLDPKVPNPKLTQPIVNFAIKHCAALVLSLLQREARRMEEQGPSHPVMQAMLRDPFYKDFYGPRLLWYCRRTGQLELPPIIEHLGLDLEAAGALDPYA